MLLRGFHLGALPRGLVVADANVRCSGRFVSKTVAGLSTKRHDGGAIVSGGGSGPLIVRLLTTTPAANPQGYRNGAYFIDGAYGGDIVTTVENAYQDFFIDLGSGDHTWQIWEAINYDPNPANTTFTSVFSVVGDVALDTQQTPAIKVAVYGDSISTNVIGSHPHKDGPLRVLRDGLPSAHVGLDAIPGRKSGDDTASAFGDSMVALTSGAASRKAIVLLGYNDYGNNIAVATYATNMAAKLDDANGKDASIHFVVISPIVATVETANGVGATLQDYRDALETVCSTRTSFVTFVDGVPIMATTDLADGVHPSVAGCALLGAAELAAVS